MQVLYLEILKIHKKFEQNLYQKSVENLLRKKFRGSIEEVCLLLHIWRCLDWNFFWNLISGGCGIRMSWVEIFCKINWRGEMSIRDLTVYKKDTWKQGSAKQEDNSPPLVWNLLVFSQNMSVIFPDPMWSVNLEYFITKSQMQSSNNIQSCRNQTFTSNDSF